MSSRAKVTITLGRRGQVVKTASSTSTSTAQIKLSGAGGKRPITDRLGAADPTFPGGQTNNNKRQRMEINGSGLGAGILDQHIGGGDLRLKLIQKGVTKKPPTNNGETDLREKLLRKLSKRPASNYPSNHTMGRERERKKEREREIEKQRERQSERGIDLPARRVAVTRSADKLLPYPSWAYDSRDELHPSHRGGCPLTPPPPPPLNKPFVDLGPVGTVSAVGSRPCSSGCGFGLKKGSDSVGGSRAPPDYATNGLSMEMRKGILQPLPPQRQTDLPATVDELLTKLELDKYKIIFKVEEVDMGALKQMGDSDLKELGIPMGPRKKILLAVRSSAKQRPH